MVNLKVDKTNKYKNNGVLKISIIIPAPSWLKDISILRSLENIDYPKEKIEIIIVTGNHPSMQRNEAAKVAKGDILCFFNRNSQPPPDIFSKIVDIFNKDQRIAGVGGPDITPQGNSYTQRLFGYAMGSYFAHWRMRARYKETGQERVSDEKELVLSNLAIKKDIYLKVSGFNEELYPNEENELINRILKMGHRFIYSPEIKVYRDRRKNLFGFMRQFYRYGCGRMNQVFVEGPAGNLLFFMPVFFLMYLFALLFVKRAMFNFIPLISYVTLGVADAAYISVKTRKNLILALPLVYAIMHISYGAGMIAEAFQRFGIFRSRKNPLSQNVKVEVWKDFF